MLATALALQNATSEAVHDEMIIEMASELYHHKDELNSEQFAEALYMYSAMLASVTTTLVTSTLLTESQLDDMMSVIREFQDLGKDIESGN